MPVRNIPGNDRDIGFVHRPAPAVVRARFSGFRPARHRETLAMPTMCWSWLQATIHRHLRFTGLMTVAAQAGNEINEFRV